MPRDVEDYAEDFAEMALSLHDESTFEDTVERVLEYALKALNCAYAGVIVVHDKQRMETVAATHPLVATLDTIQFECGQGPDLEMIDDRHSVLVPDIERERRWPEWAKLVSETGIKSMLGTRLHTTSDTIGSLNFYDIKPGHFTSVDVDVAHVLARHAAVALDSARDTDNLWQAIDARNLVGQAQGILMERFAIDADQAYAVLRRYSQHRNIKLHTVAERLISTRRLPD